MRLELLPIINIDQKANPLHEPNQSYHKPTPEQRDHSHGDILEGVVTGIDHDANADDDEDHGPDVDRQDEEELPGEAVVISAPECDMDLGVDILVVGFPEYFAVLKPVQKLADDILEIDVQVALEQMENHDHVDDSKAHDDHGAEQVQNNDSIGDTIVVEDAAFVVGDPCDQDEEGLQDECEK